MLLKKTSSQQQCIIMMKHSVGCPGGCTVSGTRSVPWPATVQTVRLRPCFTGTARSGTKLKTSATRLAPHICRIAAVSSLAAVSTSTSSTHSSSHVLQHTYCSQAARSRQRIRCRAGNSNGGGSASAEAVVDQEQAEVIEPFSEDDLQALSELENYIDVDVVGEAWRSQFADDVDGLYDYVDRGHMELAERIEDLHEQPEHLWNQLGFLDKLRQHPPGLIADMMGMGTWRLKGNVDEVFEFMVTRIEGSFRELLETDLALYPADKWKAKGWDFLDSMDPDKEWDGLSYVDMPNPPKGMEGYPRLLIENRVYSSRVFRKLHLEVAVRQDGLQVLHMVLYPRYDFDIPILALDLVAAGGSVSLAIVDTCPVTSRLTLPQHYVETILELQDNFLPDSCKERKIPDWGKQIFSPLCVCIKPEAPEELAGFMKYAVALTRAHLMYSQLLQPLSPTDKPSARRLVELLACHKRFCEQQLANTKTSRVLEVAFDKEFTDAYMTQMMFDFSPKEDVPWFDGSLAKLYEYFENTPEVWADAGEFMKTRMKLDDQKASDYLRRFLAGDASIKLPRLSFALQHMYEQDPDFRSAVDRSLADKDEDDIPAPAEVGEHLALQLMDMFGAQRPSEQEIERQEPEGPSEPDEVVGEEGVVRVVDRVAAEQASKAAEQGGGKVQDRKKGDSESDKPK